MKHFHHKTFVLSNRLFADFPSSIFPEFVIVCYSSDRFSYYRPFNPTAGKKMEKKSRSPELSIF